LNLPFFIAKRYLISKKSHNAINIISGISVIGIAIGTMALIVILSVFNGLSDLVKSLYNSINADIEITIKNGKVFDPSATEIQSLKKMKDIAYYTEIMQGNALLKYNEKQCVATIKGVSASYSQMTGFDTLVGEGVFNINKNEIVIGKGVEYTLNHGLEDIYTPVSIYAPKRGEIKTFDSEGGLNELKTQIAGIFSINEDVDKYVIMNIENARTLFDYKNEVSAIEINLKKGADLEKVQKQVSFAIGDKYIVKNREQQNALLYKTMKSEKLWTFIILVFILAIATFNVVASLSMLILEKKKDITILHHMGGSTQLIREIFLIEGILITLIGALIGLLLGTLLCWLQIHYSLVPLNVGYVVNAYPVKMIITDFVLVFSTVVFIGVLAAWYPVRVFTKKHLLD
jgi:lipoprotein-releasing system permease protein